MGRQCDVTKLQKDVIFLGSEHSLQEVTEIVVVSSFTVNSVHLQCKKFVVKQSQRRNYEQKSIITYSDCRRLGLLAKHPLYNLFQTRQRNASDL